MHWHIQCSQQHAYHLGRMGLLRQCTAGVLQLNAHLLLDASLKGSAQGIVGEIAGSRVAGVLDRVPRAQKLTAAGRRIRQVGAWRVTCRQLAVQVRVLGRTTVQLQSHEALSQDTIAALDFHTTRCHETAAVLWSI